MKKIILVSIMALFSFISCATTNIAEKTEPKNEKKIIVKEPLLIIADKRELDSESLTFEEKQFDFAQIFALANSYFDIERYDEARNLYSRIIEKYPKFSMISYCYFNVGLIYMKRNDFEKSSEFFLKSFEASERNKDKLDSLLLYLESLKKSEKWLLAENIAEETLNKNPKNLEMSSETQNEISLRMAEAIIMQGKLAEGRKLVNYYISEIRKKYSRADLTFNSEYAMAQYILGMSVVYEFRNYQLEANEASLIKKCTYILEAIKYFLTSIRAGVIYWTNASAFEIANMYTTLFTEMELAATPENLDADERAVYQCEVFNKISGLLRKAKKTIEGSIIAAKNIKEENEYIVKSLEMLNEINDMYDKKDSFCKNPIKKEDEQQESSETAIAK